MRVKNDDKTGLYELKKREIPFMIRIGGKSKKFVGQKELDFKGTKILLHLTFVITEIISFL